MTEEQRKVRKFYKDFLKLRGEVWVQWLGAGFSAVLYVIFSTIPGRELLIENTDEEIRVFVLLWMLILAPLAGFFYLLPYSTLRGRNGGIKLADRLKYLPIDLKEICRMKVAYIVKFYARILPICLVLQQLTTYASYKYFSWWNVLYILVVAFVWPVAVNLVAIYLDGDADVKWENFFRKYWKVIVVVAVVLWVVYLFFPQNVKMLFLKGSDEETVTIIVSDVSGGEQKEYELSGEQRERMLALWEKSYVRVKLISESSISEHYMGYYIFVQDNQDWIYFYSEDIISINGQQYWIYSDGMAEEFREIFESQ